MDMCEMMLIDMHGVTYANNLLKNPATKRLSGKRTKKHTKKRLHTPKGEQWQRVGSCLFVFFVFCYC